MFQFLIIPLQKYKKYSRRKRLRLLFCFFNELFSVFLPKNAYLCELFFAIKKQLKYIY